MTVKPTVEPYDAIPVDAGTTFEFWYQEFKSLAYGAFWPDDSGFLIAMKVAMKAAFEAGKRVGLEINY